MPLRAKTVTAGGVPLPPPRSCPEGTDEGERTGNGSLCDPSSVRLVPRLPPSPEGEGIAFAQMRGVPCGMIDGTPLSCPPCDCPTTRLRLFAGALFGRVPNEVRREGCQCQEPRGKNNPFVCSLQSQTPPLAQGARAVPKARKTRHAERQRRIPPCKSGNAPRDARAPRHTPRRSE